MLDCGCPAGKHIEDLEISECSENRGQLQKVIFQRISSEPGVKNSIGFDKLKTKAAMEGLAAAANGTKIVISPFLEDPSFEPGAPITYGGSNQTRNGIPIILDGEPTAVKARMNGMWQKTIAQMKKLMCENLGVYLIFEGGNICCMADDYSLNPGPESPTKLMPIPLQSLFIGDLKTGDRTEPDANMIQWNFPSNWSDKTVTIKRSELDYDPLTELINASSV